MSRFFVFLTLLFHSFGVVTAQVEIPLERSETAQAAPDGGAIEFELRTWTDKNDRKLRATFIELKDGKVKLRSENGSKTFDVPLDKLGTADRVYLRNKRVEFVERIKTDKTEAERRIAESGGVVSLHDEEGEPIPAGFSKMYRSPFTAARSVAYGADGHEMLVWGHDNRALLWDNRTGRKLKAFKGNTSGAEVVAFNADGRFNLGGSGNSVLLKDTLTGRVLQTFEEHTGFVTAVALSSDGKWGLSGASDKTAILWDLESGTMKHRLQGHKGRVLSVAFHPAGRHLLSGDDEGIAIQWDLESGRAAKTSEKLSGPINSVSYNQDGAVAMLIAPNTAILWDTYVETQANRGGSGRRENPVLGTERSLALVRPKDPHVYDALFESVAFSKDNTFFLLVSKVGNVYIGNLKSKTWIRKIEKSESGVNRAGFNDRGTEYLTVSFNDNAIFWDNTTGEKINEFRGYNYCVSPIRMTRDGRRILTSGGWADPTIAIWDTLTGTLLKRLEGHKTAVRFMRVLPDGKRLLSVSFEPFNDRRHGFDAPEGRKVVDPRRHVILWDIPTGKPLIEVKDAVGGALSPNGKELITATTKKPDAFEGDMISFWDTHTGRRQREAELKSGDLGHDFLFYPDGRRLLAKRGNDAFNWVGRSGKEAGIFRSLRYDVWTGEFSPDGKYLISGTDDGRAVYWNLLKDSKEHEFGGHGGAVICVAISPDGRRVLTGSTDKTAILWDCETGDRIKILKSGDGSIVGVAFTQDGRLAMVASEDGTVTFHAL